MLFRITVSALIASFFTSTLVAATNCKAPASRPPLAARPGFAEFMTASAVEQVRAALPQVEDEVLKAAFASPDTMWYDEASMEFMYQDSEPSVVGLRANCVGRRVGETNTIPAIRRLVEFFGPDYRFRFPFRTAAGTDDIPNVAVFQFWVPPTRDGEVLPVKYWHNGQRSHFNWTFPNGTLFGEMLFQTDAQGKLFPFEVRTRLRYSGGWAVQTHRPFQTAKALATHIKDTVGNWQMQPKLVSYIESLESKDTLVAASVSSVPFAKVFAKVDGALDPLPDHGDEELIKHLLTTVPFKPTEGIAWKRNSQFETYAPSSTVAFNIVPKDYKIGLFPVNEESCNRCHDAVSKPLGKFHGDIIAYGEMWGGDRIFTWHPFQPSNFWYGTFDDSEYPHKKINPRLTTAGLIVNSKPAANDPLYSPFKE